MNAFLALSICVFLGNSQPANQDTRRAVLESYYQKTLRPSCEGTPRENEPVHLESIKYCDVDGDGIEEIIVIGSSCGSGTGGSDIHDVLKISADGTISNITPREASKYGDTFKGIPIYDQLVGNTNYDLSFKNGFLFYNFRDSSERPDPLVLKFKWVKGQFKLIEVIKNGLTFRSTRTRPLRGNVLDNRLDFSSPSFRAASAAPVSFPR